MSDQKDDLVSRVANYQAEPKTEPAPEPKPDEIQKFDYSKLQTLQSADEAKQWAESAYKSMQSDYGRKTQELAEQRKQLEQSQVWSKDRIAQVVNDPNFQSAAQAYMQSQKPPGYEKTDEEWSALTDGEKKQWFEMQKEITLLKQQNHQTLIAQQDEKLKDKYANYDPIKVDTFYEGLSTGKVQANRGHLWKALDYDDAVRRAYELGRKEAGEHNKDIASALSIDSPVNVKPEATKDPGKILSMVEIYSHQKQQQRESELRK